MVINPIWCEKIVNILKANDARRTLKAISVWNVSYPCHVSLSLMIKNVFANLSFFMIFPNDFETANSSCNDRVNLCLVGFWSRFQKSNFVKKPSRKFISRPIRSDSKWINTLNKHSMSLLNEPDAWKSKTKHSPLPPD